MVVKFYKTKTEKNSLSKNLTDEKQKTGHLKDNCDVLNPTIIFNYDNELMAYNYARVDAFGRFYFVDGFNVIGKTIEISLKVDVLTTYANDIKNSYATIVRSNMGDRFLPDNRVSKMPKTNTTLKKLGVGFLLSDTYIVTVGGK